MKIYLCSESPRRREILQCLDIRFEQMAPGVTEVPDGGDAPLVYVQKTARRKLRAGVDRLRRDGKISAGTLVIAADTIVTDKKRIFGKPKDSGEAREILRALSGEKHYVVTALSLSLFLPGKKVHCIAVSKIKVQFIEISDEMLDEYLDGDEWKDKAGAYAIQGQGSAFVDFFQGSLTGIIGFPVRLFFRMIVAMHVSPLSLYESDEGEK